MAYETIRLEIDKSVATLTLDRPASRNAMNTTMAAEIQEALGAVAGTEEVRALIVTGAGRNFCSGGDITAMAQQLTMSLDARRRDLLRFYRSFLRIRDLEVPTIAAINGHAMGAGLAFALACDLRLAAEQAKLGLSFTKIGLHPGMGSCYFMTRVLGTARALELLWTGDAISAAEGEKLGLINRVVTPDALGQTTRELAARLAAGPAIPLRLIKKTVYRAADDDLQSILEQEAFAQATCTMTEDFKEGVSAFLEKRSPQFRGT